MYSNETFVFMGQKISYTYYDYCYKEVHNDNQNTGTHINFLVHFGAIYIKFRNTVNKRFYSFFWDS